MDVGRRVAPEERQDWYAECQAYFHPLRLRPFEHEVDREGPLGLGADLSDERP